MRIWDPFLFALSLWLIVLGTAALSLFSGLWLDVRLGTSPLFEVLGALLALGSSIVAGIWLLRGTLDLWGPAQRGRVDLLGAFGFALRIELIVFGLGALAVIPGAYVDLRLQSGTAIGTIAGVVLGLIAATVVAVRYTAGVVQQIRGQS